MHTSLQHTPCSKLGHWSPRPPFCKNHLKPILYNNVQVKLFYAAAMYLYIFYKKARISWENQVHYRMDSSHFQYSNKPYTKPWKPFRSPSSCQHTLNMPCHVLHYLSTYTNHELTVKTNQELIAKTNQSETIRHYFVIIRHWRCINCETYSIMIKDLIVKQTKVRCKHPQPWTFTVH